MTDGFCLKLPYSQKNHGNEGWEGSSKSDFYVQTHLYVPVDHLSMVITSKAGEPASPFKYRGTR